MYNNIKQLLIYRTDQKGLRPVRVLSRVQALQEVRPGLHEAGEEDVDVQRESHLRQDRRNLQRHSLHVPAGQQLPDYFLHLGLQVGQISSSKLCQCIHWLVVGCFLSFCFVL